MADIPGELIFPEMPEGFSEDLKKQLEDYTQGLRRYMAVPPGRATYTEKGLGGVDTPILIRELIRRMGDDPDRPGLLETPMRVLNSWSQLFFGYDFKDADINEFLKLFDEPNCDGMVILSNVEFYATCEHHLLPYFGQASVAYIPQGGRVVGISKLARLLEVYSRRLTTQERITAQIVKTLMESPLKPLGAGCVMKGRHMCMCARGVNKQNSMMHTSEMLGVFRDKPEVRAEFLSIANQGSS